MAAGKLVDKVAAMLLIVQHLCPGQNIPDAVRALLRGATLVSVCV